MAVLFIDLVSTKIIIILASERYLEASILVFPVCMAFAIKSLGGITNIGISLSKKTQFYLISYLCSIIAFFMSFLYLIPQYGILAIAFSFLISQIIKAIISTFLAQLLYPIKWDYKPLIIIISLTLIFGLFTNYAKIDNEHRVLSIIVFMFFMFIYFVLSLRKILKNEVEN